MQAASGSASAIRELQVPRQVSDLDHAINQVEKSVEVLRDRLTSVLPQGPGTPKALLEKSSDAPGVPLANQLRELRKRADSVLASIEELVGAVEL